MSKIIFNTDFANAVKAFKEKNVKLYPHQKEGIKWLLKKERKSTGGLLADDMGLGKTIQMIGMMVGNPQKITIIVVPSSLENQWKSEIKKFSNIQILDIFDYETKPSENNVIITSYNKLMYNFTPHLETFMENIGERFEVDRLVCDEAHFFRNSKSVSFKSLERINSKYRWAITGTPIQNYLSDIKTLFKFLGFHDTSLENSIEKHMLRRTQEEVKIELPKVKTTLSFVNIEDYDEKFYNIVDTNDDIHHLEKNLRLRQICVVPESVSGILGNKYSIRTEEKLNCVKLKKIVKTLKKNKGNERPIVFVYFKSEITFLYAHLSNTFKTGVIYGGVPQIERKEIIEDQTHELLIVQINSGGTGLNLQHFNTVYFTSPQWNPEVEAQAIARVNRIGQTDTVTVRRFVVGNLKKDTIEKRIIKIQKKKKEMIDEWINKKDCGYKDEEE